MNRSRLTLVTLIALSLCCIAGMALAAGNPQGGPFATGDLVRCGTVEHGRPAAAPPEDQIRQWISENRIAAGGVIRVNFHVIYTNSSNDVPDAWIDEQIVRLNYNFAGKDYFGNPVPGAANTGYTFVEGATDHTLATGKRKSWFSMTPGSRAERNAKDLLAINWTSELNFYTCQPGQNLLGWATFPWDLSTNGKQDGVVIHWASLPGGPLEPYDQGGTATHEIGHWVGLYHTFQGGCGTSDCANTGDLICDTPAEGSYAVGCPEGRNTCTSLPGDDPIHNYMDYTDDLCYTNFTPGQDVRADWAMSTYRPLIGSARIADFTEPGNGSDPGDTFRANESHGPRTLANGETVYRCATETRGRHVPVPEKAQIDRWIAENRIAAGGVIPVNFHVIWSSRYPASNVDEAWLDEQIVRLNYNYAGKDYFGTNVPGACNTGYTFVKDSVTYTQATKKTSSWFGMTPGSKGERDAKNSLAVNWTSSLNFYTCQPGQNLLGWATFPWDLSTNGKQDGVVIHWASLPGGPLEPYDQGGTATHEVGHWVGLLHTFQGGCGSNCSTSGDEVCDTEPEASAAFGCPEGRDTCPSGGNGIPDPIHNYMDYTDDLCYTNFTCGQDARADVMMATYRPAIGSGRLAQGGTVQMAAGATGNGLRAVPNPFNPRTKIEFSMQREGHALVRVYDVQGRTVATLVNAALPKGAHRFDFDGDRLASGIYILQLRIDGQAIENRRITLMK